VELVPENDANEMGLDVYVGSLTRYYAHDWETIVQQTAKREGIEVQVIRANAPSSNEIRDPAAIQRLVVEWRQDLGASLKQAQLISTDLDWPELPDSPYFTDKPDWDCFGAMTLLAAYEEEPKRRFGGRWPKNLSESWTRDSKLAARLSAQVPPRYSHIYGCTAWIPVMFKNPIRGPVPGGAPILIGSSVALLEQLDLLNQQTFAGAPDDLARWRREMPDGADSRFEPKAKAGLAMFLELTRLAVDHRLPMLLDY
jgi:hypothetical protein